MKKKKGSVSKTKFKKKTKCYEQKVKARNAIRGNFDEDYVENETLKRKMEE